MKLSYYIEEHAKALVSDLNNSWNHEKAHELHDTLHDLFGAIKSEAEEIKLPEFKVPEVKVPEVKASVMDPPVIKIPQRVVKTRQFKGRIKRGTRKAIIDLILNEFFEKSKTGQKTFHFRGADFGVSPKYLQTKVFNYLNTLDYKVKRFPDLNIRRVNTDDGVMCRIERKAGK